MKTIELNTLLPHVFAQYADIKSDIWGQDVMLESGHTYLIEAASGTGKSSLCSYIFNYRHDYEGQILFNGKDIKRMNTAEITKLRQKDFALLWQDLRLFPELSALENVEIKNNLTHHKSKAQIDEWFERLGIADRKDYKIGKMSFGQQQRVAMMRTLCQPFSFIMADEPISHLDDENSRIMGEIMMEEARRQDAGIIVTSIGKRMMLEYDVTLKL